MPLDLKRQRLTAALRAAGVIEPPKTFPEKGLIPAFAPYVLGAYYGKHADKDQIIEQAMKNAPPAKRTQVRIGRALHAFKDLPPGTFDGRSLEEVPKVIHAEYVRDQIREQAKDRAGYDPKTGAGEQEYQREYTLSVGHLLNDVGRLSDQEWEAMQEHYGTRSNIPVETMKSDRDWLWRQSQLNDDRNWAAEHTAKSLAAHRGGRTFNDAQQMLADTYKLPRSKARALLVEAGWKPEGKPR